MILITVLVCVKGKCGTLIQHITGMHTDQNQDGEAA